jgi:hypothetical protein
VLTLWSLPEQLCSGNPTSAQYCTIHKFLLNTLSSVFSKSWPEYESYVFPSIKKLAKESGLIWWSFPISVSRSRGVSRSRDTLYPCQIGNSRASDGPTLDRNSEDELQPGRYVMRTPPGELARFSVVLIADICVTELAQVVVYLTTDVPRTRAYSVNCTYTPNVRFPVTFP